MSKDDARGVTLTSSYLPPPPFTFVNFYLIILIILISPDLIIGIKSCDIFMPARTTPKRGVPSRAFVVSRNVWTAMRLFCLKITRENGIICHISCYCHN